MCAVCRRPSKEFGKDGKGDNAYQPLSAETEKGFEDRGVSGPFTTKLTWTTVINLVGPMQNFGDLLLDTRMSPIDMISLKGRDNRPAHSRAPTK